jgi:urease accessory protein
LPPWAAGAGQGAAHNAPHALHPRGTGRRLSWLGHLDLHYRRDDERTVALDRHHGPLRVLQRLYPEGPGICHHVLVHPPGGVVGGDVLALDARLDEGTHAVITTPGATRFYRSDGALAEQRVQLQLAAGARLEWLPLESIAYSGCQASNQVQLDLAPGAEMLGWDLLALGLPAAGLAFEAGAFQQQLHWPGVWLERGRIAADDGLLLDGPLGLAGRRVLGTLWFAAGSALAPDRRDALLAAARAAVGADGAADVDATRDVQAGVTSPDPRLLLLRLLAHQVEPAFQLLARVRAAWREAAWQLSAEPPRIWRL